MRRIGFGYRAQLALGWLLHRFAVMLPHFPYVTSSRISRNCRGVKPEVERQRMERNQSERGALGWRAKFPAAEKTRKKRRPKNFADGVGQEVRRITEARSRRLLIAYDGPAISRSEIEAKTIHVTTSKTCPAFGRTASG
jgi:hypothetical protein